MNRITAAAAALNQTPLDWDRNARSIRQAIASAKKAGAQILCLPELCITGYGCEDLFHSEEFCERALSSAQVLARESKGLFVNFGLPLLVDGIVYNAVAVAVNGELRGFVAKQHLAGDGLHYEPRWFKPWPKGVAATTRVSGKELPVGDVIFDLGNLKIGFEICEDAWVAERPAIFLAQHGVDIVVNPSASHFAFGKHELRKRFILEGSRACGVAYLYANLLGCESGRTIYDGDTILASHGELVAQGTRFSFSDYSLVCGVLDLNRCRLQRRRLSSFRPRHDAGNRTVQVSGFNIRKPKPLASYPLSKWELSSRRKHEEFTRAVSLGLFDYMRKSRSQGFVVSLSGGVDSSAASCLVATMIEGAVKELGFAGLSAKLSYIPDLQTARGEKELCKRLLTCVYQGTKNSSSKTRRAATEVAEQLGATFFDLDVDFLVDGYTDLITKAMKLKLSWKTDDIALQNIQARVRSPSVWLIANIRKALLLATSNRSEASVGYTTMDGDSSGGLAPLGGIDKAYLREWLRWLESEGPTGLRSYSSLALVNEQAPTAELKPLSAKQTDEGDLMPYVVLDRIERLAVRDKLMPMSVYDVVVGEFTGVFPAKQIAEWVERFFRLWSMNQWKRERFAPSFHLDDENVDPKTWCRFPILSGGFEKELAALRSKRR